MKILIFRVVKGLKEQKLPQNVENFCLLHLIFQEPYIIWSSFVVHMYIQKDNISSHFFLFFKKILIFRIISGGGKKAKNGPKWQKMFCPDLRNCTSYDCDIWCTYVRWWYLQQIFSFFKILIFGVSRFFVKGQKMT